MPSGLLKTAARVYKQHKQQQGWQTFIDTFTNSSHAPLATSLKGSAKSIIMSKPIVTPGG